MSKSVIKKADLNKPSIQKIIAKTRKNLQEAGEIHFITRFLEYEKDKEKVAEILGNIQDAQKVLSELLHIIVHDEYWAKLRGEE